MNLASVIKRAQENREDWVYTDLNRFEDVLSSSVIPVRGNGDLGVGRSDELVKEGGVAYVTFINGNFLPDASNMGGLPEGFIKGSAEDGYVICVADKTCLVTTPVELRFISHGQAKEISAKIRIELGESCRLNLIEKHEASGPAQVIETSIKLAARAKLVHGKILSQEKQNSPAHFSFADVRVEEGAYYESFSLLVDGSLARNETEVVLAGPMAQCNLRGAMLLAGKAHVDTTVRVRHSAPECVSRQVYKTVAADNSRGVFQGKIIVDKDAQKSDGYQLSRALLLSDKAEADAKPELEINADDVKCSHGSTMGDLDASALFYLRSRGVEEKDARALLIRAFIDELVDDVREPLMIDAIKTEVERWLENVK